MITQPIHLPSANTDVLFNDRALLEATFGKAAFQSSLANANCDCISHVLTEDDEDTYPHPIAPAAA